MFNRQELQVIELCLMAQMSAIKEKLEFYKACRKYERLNGCRGAMKYFEELRDKVESLKDSANQISIISE